MDSETPVVAPAEATVEETTVEAEVAAAEATVEEAPAGEVAE